MDEISDLEEFIEQRVKLLGAVQHPPLNLVGQRVEAEIILDHVRRIKRRLIRDQKLKRTSSTVSNAVRVMEEATKSNGEEERN